MLLVSVTPSENLVILSLNLAPPRSGPVTFKLLAATRLNPSHRACWTLDGNYILVASLTGAVAIWNWRTDEWGFVKLTLGERDDSNAQPEELVSGSTRRLNQPIEEPH